MIQEIIIGVVFLAALSYIGHLIYNAFQTKQACASGCGKCGAVDFEKIEKRINSELSFDTKS